MWFTEEAWSPIIVLATVAVTLTGLWWSRQQGRWLAGALVCVMAAVAVYFTERAIVTEREQIARKVRELVGAFQRKDSQATLSYFSRQEPELRQMAQTALGMVDIPGPLSIKQMQVDVYNENSQADSEFRANGMVSHLGSPPRYAASRWRVHWQREGQDWKIVEVKRLGLSKGEPMDVFDPRQ
ncbi:MAG: hypothetical protein ACT4QC_13855 [Planctomycetaceae bacterium]